MGGSQDFESMDPMGYRDDLEDVLRLPALAVFEQGVEVPTESRRAAANLAIALGNCRLFGVEVEHDGTLPIRVALAAAEELARDAEEYLGEAESLPQRFDDAEPECAEEEATEPLEYRMQLWAALEAMEEALNVAYETRDPAANALADAVDRLLTSTQKIDDVLTQPEQLEILAIATETQLLSNWRAMLAPKYQEFFPWWLDGTLEEVAKMTAAASQTDEPQVIPGPWFRQSAVAAAVGRLNPTIKWESPDHNAFALMERVTSQASNEPISIKFFASDGSRWLQGAGRAVQFGPLTSVIDESGVAKLVCADILALAESEPAPPDLIIGAEGERWSCD